MNKYIIRKGDIGECNFWHIYKMVDDGVFVHFPLVGHIDNFSNVLVLLNSSTAERLILRRERFAETENAFNLYV